VIALELAQDTKRSWKFFRDAGKNELWPHIEAQYREELEGIAAGLHAHGVKLDVWDVVALNATLEWNPYYMKWYEQKHKKQLLAKLTAPETLQRVCRHRRVHERWARGDGAQRLDRLPSTVSAGRSFSTSPRRAGSAS